MKKELRQLHKEIKQMKSNDNKTAVEWDQVIKEVKKDMSQMEVILDSNLTSMHELVSDTKKTHLETREMIFFLTG